MSSIFSSSLIALRPSFRIIFERFVLSVEDVEEYAVGEVQSKALLLNGVELSPFETQLYLSTLKDNASCKLRNIIIISIHC